MRGEGTGEEDWTLITQGVGGVNGQRKEECLRRLCGVMCTGQDQDVSQSVDVGKTGLSVEEDGWG